MRMHGHRLFVYHIEEDCMNKTIKLTAMLRIAGIIAMVAVVGFSMVACGGKCVDKGDCVLEIVDGKYVQRKNCGMNECTPRSAGGSLGTPSDYKKKCDCD